MNIGLPPKWLHSGVVHALTFDLLGRKEKEWREARGRRAGVRGLGGIGGAGGEGGEGGGQDGG